MTTQLDLRLRIEADGKGASQELKNVAQEVKRVSAAAEENNRVTQSREVSSRRLVQVINDEGSALRAIPDNIRRMAAAYVESGRAVAAREAEGRRYISSLQAEIRELTLGEAGLMRYKAAQLGVMASAQPLITQLESLRAHQKAANDEQVRGAGATNGLAAALGPLGGYIAGAFSVGAVVAFSKSVVQAGMELQKIRSGMTFATGSPEAGEAAYGRLRGLVREFGLDLESSARAFMRFNAAAQGTALQGSQSEKVFRAVAGAITTLGLTASEADGVFLAIGQMISKGTVQAEELRGQLGERLPGAFQIAARAMGVTTAELGKMLEQGQVATDVFLPKFAAEMLKTFGSSAQSAAGNAQQQINRLGSEWTLFMQTLAGGGVLSTVADLAKNLAGALEGVNKHLRENRDQGLWQAWLTSQGLIGETAIAIGRSFVPLSKSETAKRNASRAYMLGQQAADDWAGRKESALARDEEAKRGLLAIGKTARTELAKAGEKYRTPEQRQAAEIAELKKEFGGRGIDAELNRVIAQARASFAAKAPKDPDRPKPLTAAERARHLAEGWEEVNKTQGEYDAHISKGEMDWYKAGEARKTRGAAERTAQAETEASELEQYDKARFEAQQQLGIEYRDRAAQADIAAMTDGRARQQAQFEYETQLEKRRLARMDLTHDERRQREEELNQWTLGRQRQLTEDLKPEWQKMLEGWADTTRLMRESFDNFVVGGLRAGENAFVSFAQTGKLSIKSLADFVIGEFARMQYRENIAPALSLGLKSLAGMLGFGGSGLTAAQAADGTIAGVFHGGIGPGESADEARYVSPLAFANAPRLHSGAGPGERAAIITEQEGVFTPGQMRALAPVGQANVTVNIIGAPSQPTVSRSRGPGGAEQIDVFFEQVDRYLAGNISSGRGPTSAALDRFGLDRATAAVR